MKGKRLLRQTKTSGFPDVFNNRDREGDKLGVILNPSDTDSDSNSDSSKSDVTMTDTKSYVPSGGHSNGETISEHDKM